MATNTTFLGLRKPEQDDSVLVLSDIANNMQILDDKWVSTDPSSQGFGDAPDAGEALTVARADHLHGMLAAASPISLGVADAVSQGVANTFARSDHKHGVPSAILADVKSVATAPLVGTSTNFARADHVHDLPGSLTIGKNRLINGDFRVWQLGTSGPTTTDDGSAMDGWRAETETTSTGFVLSRESSDIPTQSSRYACKLAIGSSNNVKSGIFQIIECQDMIDMRGGAVSLQFQMKVSNTRIGDVRAAVVQWTGTEDNGGTAFSDPISAWGAALTVPTYTGSWANANAPANLSPTTSWAQYKIENISTNASATNFAVFIWIDDKTTTAGDYILVTDIQLEKGPVCTAYERRSLTDRLNDCFRRMWVVNGTEDGNGGANTVSGGSGYTNGTTSALFFIPMPVTMRTVPALSKVGTWQIVDSASSTFTTSSESVSTGGVSSPRNVRVAVTVSGATAGRAAYWGAATDATARLIFSANL